MPSWNISSVQHLLSRCLLGHTSKDVQIALSYSLKDYVDKVLLAPVKFPAPPGDWVSENPSVADPSKTGLRQRELINWWINQFLVQGHSLQEKMVLFWHNHFVSEMAKVGHPQRMYWQNHLFRKYAYGNFRSLTKAVTVDPAMLVYLDGVLNTKFRPNENYARELLELFTLGIGHYTETDVKEAARALTGWRVDELKSFFDPMRFDYFRKTILGKTQSFNHETLIDHIFTKPEAAEHICGKLYKEFVHHTPNITFVKQMAAVLRDSNFEIKPVLSFLLTSDHFYDTQFIGAKIKSPVELVIGTIKSLHLQTTDYTFLADSLKQLQQNLFNPPDVRGWEGQRKWISSATYPVRRSITDSCITGKKANAQSTSFKVKSIEYARTFTSSENAVKFVNEVSGQLISYPLTEKRKKFLLDTLLSGARPEDWSTQAPMADAKISDFLKETMRLPEYQLC